MASPSWRTRVSSWCASVEVADVVWLVAEVELEVAEVVVVVVEVVRLEVEAVGGLDAWLEEVWLVAAVVLDGGGWWRGSGRRDR